MTATGWTQYSPGDSLGCIAKPMSCFFKGCAVIRILVLIFCTALPFSAHADWPTFLGGPQSDWPKVKLPLNWSPTDGITWSADLPGHGQSSPVVIGNRIYVTAIEGPQKDNNLVLCFDLETSKELWRHSSPSKLKVKNDVYTSRAAPSPTADQDGVYAFFESGNFVALDPDGKVRWERSLIDDYGKYAGRFGLGGSLAQLEDRLFVLADNEGPSYLLAIDKASGETIWKSDRTSRSAWSSPMIIPVEGKPQVVVSSSGSIDGYDPADGKLLWSTDEVGGNTVPSPTYVADGQFLVGASPGRNGENADGAKQSNMLIKITSKEGEFTPEIVWRNEDATSSFGSPIAYQSHAFFTNRAGVLFCIDLVTGETAYNARIAESNWATPIGNGNRVYFFGKSGKTTVMAASPEKKQLAENQLFESTAEGRGGFGGEIQYAIALTPQGAVVRTGTKLYLIAAEK